MSSILTLNDVTVNCSICVHLCQPVTLLLLLLLMLLLLLLLVLGLSIIFGTGYLSVTGYGYPFRETISGYSIPMSHPQSQYMQYDAYPHKLNYTNLRVGTAIDTQ